MKTMLNNSMSSMLKKTATLLGLLSLVSTLTHGEVKADRIDANGRIVFSKGTWTQVVSSCTPDEDTIDYQMSGAGVSFPGTITGELTLRCNITNVMAPDANWDILEVVYNDPDGNGAANQVTVELHKVDGSGIAENVIRTTVPRGTLSVPILVNPSLIASFDSNSVTTATTSTQTRVVGFSHAFDFATNAYYVKVKVKRAAGSTTNPAAFVVRLYKDANIGG